MTTTDTRSQLLREIIARPDDDTLRLAFADWLDEQPATKTCLACKGDGRLDADHRPGTVECRMCRGAGTVPDAADRDRAEFIRVQCELGVWSGRGHPREVKLLSAHPEWSRCRCPECRNGWVEHPDSMSGLDTCPTCGGTGDLFVSPGVSGASKPRIVTFARGFVDGVTCTLAEAFGTDGTPTPWAVEVVKQTPVVRFRMTDQTPHHRDAAIRGPFAVGLVWDWSSASTPEFLMDEMAAAHPDKFADTSGGDVWWMEFETEADATDALALAAGRVVRRHAHKERT